MRLRLLLGLILCNLIWSAHPVAGKVLLTEAQPAIAAWLRYGSALVAYLLAVSVLKLRSKGKARPFFIPLSRRRDAALVFVIGLTTFCLSPLLTLVGLSGSRATDSALIIAMEPLITVGLAWIFLRERLSGGTVAEFAASVVGFLLLSGIGSGIGDGSTQRLIPNLLLLLALIGEGLYSVAGRRLVRNHAAIPVFGTGLAFGVGLLTASLPFFASGEMPDLSWKGLAALLWLGPIGTAATYLFWMVVLVEAPVASLVLTLFVQPVFGTLWGYLFFGEQLSPTQSFGALLILGALIFQAYGSVHRTPAALPNS